METNDITLRHAAAYYNFRRDQYRNAFHVDIQLLPIILTTVNAAKQLNRRSRIFTMVYKTIVAGNKTSFEYFCALVSVTKEEKHLPYMTPQLLF